MSYTVIESSRKRRMEYAHLALRKAFHPGGRVIAVTPAFADNPYQGLIYSAWSHRAVGTDMMTVAKLTKWGLATGLHLHWDEYLFSVDRPEIMQASLSAIKSTRARGGRIAFTVHNVVPHDDLGDPEKVRHFRTWRQWLLEQSDAVHVHSRAAREMILSDYDIAPERLHVVPHPSYAGVFTPLERPVAPADRRRFLGFGSVRRNKGMPNLIGAFKGLAVPGRDIELHIAGRGAEAFEGADLGGNRLILSPGFVAEVEIPRLFADAEFCVFGFDSALTSGSLMLALTLGKPVIVPEFASLMEVFEGGPAPLSYKPGDVEDLTSLLARAAAMDEDEIAELAEQSLRIAKALDPTVISRQLEEALFGR